MEADNICILAIESSCDDTSAAVIKGGKVLANIIVSQAIHAEWGGIVPELASRAHHQNIIPVVDKALKDSNVKKDELNAIAYTGGPGLMGSLMVGGSFAKAMALSLGIQTISVHHMKAHILAHFIDESKPQFPFLCLTVSGGHTEIVKVSTPHTFELIGKTKDDAAGEAFDCLTQIADTPLMWIGRGLAHEVLAGSEESLVDQDIHLMNAADAYRAALQVNQNTAALLGLRCACYFLCYRSLFFF